MSFKKGFVFLVFALLPAWVSAQFDAQRAQYMYGPVAYNPGATADKDMCNIYGDYRLQWAGFTDAPKNVVVAADLPFSIGDSRNGVGISFVDDKVGLFENQSFLVQYAYRLNLWHGTLGLGLALGAISQTYSGSEANFTGSSSNLQPGDEFHSGTSDDVTSDESDMCLEAAFGAYYSDDQFFAGLSVKNLNRPKFDVSDNYTLEIPPVFYLTAGYNMAMSNENLHFKPSFLACTDFNSKQLTLDCVLDIKKKIQCGLGYRLGDSFNFLIGADNIFDGLFLGYSYDLPVSGMIKSGGSHEICLKYSFKLDLSKKNKYKSERIL